MRARVTYQDGRDTYSDVVVNEMPMETYGAAPLGMNRVATAGEFGSDLVGLFKPPVAAEFRFRKEARIGSQAALVFDFHVPAAKNHFWTAGSSKGTFNPELRGELWVRPQDARLLRIKIEPLHLPSDFPIISSSTTVDYGEVSLSEAGVFLLPVYSESEPCLRVSRGFAEDGCVRNKTWFYKCRKFRAKARIIGEPELQ